MGVRVPFQRRPAARRDLEVAQFAGLVGLREQQLARELSGEDLPSATLCWVWATTEAVGARICLLYTSRCV